MKQGEVWLTALDPTVGAEIQKTRPSVILSPDELNGSLRTVIVAPMTSGSRPARFRIDVQFKGRSGLILPDQMRSLDRQRFIRRLGRIDTETLEAVLRVLRDMFTA